MYDNIDFKIKKITRDKEEHFLITKESVYKEDITILNEYSLNNRASKYKKQKLIMLKGEKDKATVSWGWHSFVRN
jgi:hypothetical protein